MIPRTGFQNPTQKDYNNKVDENENCPNSLSLSQAHALEYNQLV